jgi:hypothetical protein
MPGMNEPKETWNFDGEDEEIIKVELAPGLGILIWISILFAFIILGCGIWYLVTAFG